MKLQTKLAVVLVAVTLILSAATYGGLELYKQEELQRSESAVEESATLGASQLASSLDERADYLGYVASQPEVANFSDNSAVIDGIVDNSRFSAVQVIDANGTVLAFGGQIDEAVRESTLGSDVSDEEYFTAARYRGSSVSTPEYVSSHDQYLVVVSAPVLREGRVVGVLAASMYVSPDTFLEPVVPLVRHDQRVTVSVGDAVLYESRGPFERAMTGRAAVVPYGWTVTVERDRATLDARIRTLGAAQGVGLLSVLLLVGLLWWTEHRTTLRQTRQLLDGFEALRVGEYDRTLDLRSAEEWARISDGFNALSTGLDERETALREREQRLGVLNRVLRHNVRNEMNVVLGYADVVASRAEDPETARAAETILRRGERLVAVSEKARVFDRRLDETDPATLDLVTVVEDALADVAADHPEAELTPTTPDSLAVRVVPGIGDAVRNVVENACVHHEGTPSVAVVVGADGDEATVAVADDGPGIPEHERSVLAEGEETALDHGSGIGLWVTKWLVGRSGGSVAFEENDPRGSVVTLRLPLADEMEAVEDGEASGGDGSKPR
ncbi:integral membrane sensor signal transduction histidine kinase [Halogeometricum pallidum JCM 14848]|uniref:histidine kinase n=1 Tax=Halogeometricum pallidum JCM 14848 TaxID=1227487 RepID=M0CSC4_HALPD|nr:sensor histidine kinase [Halogeometricum pallidum]ELZ26165.1 integral membrane sensor signal transduction histidine kinase [Halogeometricum pallidum JCM 14848]